MTDPIPFEVEYPSQASFLASVYARARAIKMFVPHKGEGPFVKDWAAWSMKITDIDGARCDLQFSNR